MGMWVVSVCNEGVYMACMYVGCIYNVGLYNHGCIMWVYMIMCK
jgi:hypothetical protein